MTASGARPRYGAPVRWAVPLLIGCASCAPYTQVTARGAGVVEAVLLLLDAEDGAPIEARAFDPATAQLGFHTREGVVGVVLGYPQPLASYGIRTREGGALVLDPGAPQSGLGLPPPALWTTVDADGVASPVDLARHTPAALYPRVRLPRAPCPVLEEVAGRRVPLPPGADVSFLGVLDEQRLLVGLEGGAEFRPVLAVATTTTVYPVPIALDYGSPVGFTEADGSMWVALDLPDVGLEVGERVLCHFVPGGPLDVSACDLDPAAKLADHPLRMAGQRDAEGRLEIVAIDDELRLVQWRGDANDRGTWRAVYRGGELERPSCEVGHATMALELEEPGRGVASFESGALERFHIGADGAAERTVLFDPPGRGSNLCRSGYARSASGAELLVEEARVEPTPSVAPTRIWWRAGGQGPWTELPNLGLIDTHGVVAVGDAFLATSGNDTVTLLAMDPRRPDAPPQICSPVSVFNSGEMIVPFGDTLVVGGDGTVLLNSLTVSRWRLRGT